MQAKSISVLIQGNENSQCGTRLLNGLIYADEDVPDSLVTNWLGAVHILHITIFDITNIQLLLTLEKVAPTLFMLFVLLESGISIRKLYSWSYTWEKLGPSLFLTIPLENFYGCCHLLSFK